MLYKAIRQELGLEKKRRRGCYVYIDEEFYNIIVENGFKISTVINIGLEMFLRSRGLYPRK